MSDLKTYLKSGEYLPEVMRDFHDQKDLFKAIDALMQQSDEYRVDWVRAHIYVVDIFLWFMAKRGYTLQRSRKRVQVLDLEQTIATEKEKRDKSMAVMLGLTEIKETPCSPN